MNQYVLCFLLVVYRKGPYSSKFLSTNFFFLGHLGEDILSKPYTRRPHMHGPLIFNKGSPQFKGERIMFSRNGAGTIGKPHAKIKKEKQQISILPLFHTIKIN